MKERPILFSGPMVRALLNGSKTQTRRVVKPQHLRFFDQSASDMLANWSSRPFPYGQPATCCACAGCGAIVHSGHRVGGDRLYVRETWSAPHAYDHLPPSLIPKDARIHYAATEDRGGLLWRPSIHMPRWASRITLEITGVRVERLQDISEADALAEGITRLPPPPPPQTFSGPNRFTLGGMGVGACAGSVIWSAATAQNLYRRLWEPINGPDSWDANPWVWVVEFKRVQGGAA